MKKRFGFVSNSSSSSFVIQTIDRGTIELILEKLVEAYNLASDEKISARDICWLNELNDVDEVDVRAWNRDSKNKITLKQFKDMEKHAEVIPGIEIESCNDNSIPYPIMGFLEHIGTRYHWS